MFCCDMLDFLLVHAPLVTVPTNAPKLKVAMFCCLKNIIIYVSKYIYAVLFDEYNQQKKTPTILLLVSLQELRHQPADGT